MNKFRQARSDDDKINAAYKVNKDIDDLRFFGCGTLNYASPWGVRKTSRRLEDECPGLR